MFGLCELKRQFQLFKEANAEVGSIGKTELGEDIPYVFCGNKGGATLVVVGATHAREHITAKLTSKQAERIISGGVRLDGGIYFVPMLNIDGVRLCIEGADFIADKARREFLLGINGKRDFSLWKANADGVDLNVNFNARWGTGKQNLFFPAPFNYVGKAPMSAKETRAVANFIMAVKADMVVSYHAKGEIIYWQFFQKALRLRRDLRYALLAAKITGYELVGQTQSAGGLKDWCVEKLKIPAITVEVGSDRFGYPYPYGQFADIFAKNARLPQTLLAALAEDKYHAEQVHEDGDQ